MKRETMGRNSHGSQLATARDARAARESLRADHPHGCLEFRIDADRHYLLDEPIHCGDGLEIHLADGTWLAGRYEIERGRDGVICPRFFWNVRLAGDEPGVAWDAWIPIPAHAELRWPPK